MEILRALTDTTVPFVSRTVCDGFTHQNALKRFVTRMALPPAALDVMSRVAIEPANSDRSMPSFSVLNARVGCTARWARTFSRPRREANLEYIAHAGWASSVSFVGTISQGQDC
jgi:hypothetical protein